MCVLFVLTIVFASSVMVCVRVVQMLEKTALERDALLEEYERMNSGLVPSAEILHAHLQNLVV